MTGSSTPHSMSGLWLDRLGVRLLQSRRSLPLARLLLARRVHKADREVHIYYAPNRITFTQTHPFIRYRQMLYDRFGLGLRAFSIWPHLDGKPLKTGAAHILVSPWFTVSPDALAAFLDKVRAANPAATIDFIDSTAPADLRLGHVVAPHVRYYLKKSFLKDRDRYQDTWLGDTNLSDYVARTFDVPAEPNDQKVPPDLIPRLRVSPNFFTSPLFFDTFLQGASPPDGPRDIDVHARMATDGGVRPLLRDMALSTLTDMPGNHLISTDRVDWATYMGEMKRSKICLSPFGFGELCWRDIEAFATGAVLVKPDMSHLDTAPDLYVPGETYMPVAWDSSDLAEVVQEVQHNTALRQRLAQNAWGVIHDYLRTARFVDDTAYLWETD